MAATKEAIAIILDVGPSMNQVPPGAITSLESAIEGINMILQRKIFAESKDEVALIIFGTPGTDNPLDDGESYQHITLLRSLGVVDFDLLQMVQSDLQPSNTPGDFLDAIVVALDHLEKGLQGKKGFGSRRLILFTDLGGPFGDQELDTIVAAMSNTKTELNVIGPNLDDENAEGNGSTGGSGGSGAGPSIRKEKTSQQKSGEALVKHMLDQVNGECYSFSEALPALSYFQSRQVKPMAWKCNLEIGQMEIPINGYSKVKDFKLKQSWKKVYAQDPNIIPQTLPSYHMTNEEETEVEKEDMVEGFKYGNTIVPMSEDDKDNMKYKAEKCLKVLGFTKAENFKRYHILGDGVLSITAEKGDEAAAVALSALINALYETNTVAIARRVYDARSSPRLGALFPHIKAKYECLFWVELPFAEDVRTFTFGSLPLTEEVTVNKKYQPTDEQLSCVDDLINTMDLSQALEDEDGDKEEALKPKITFNPYFQHVYQVSSRTPVKRKPSTLLTSEEETHLATWLAEMAKCGFGQTTEEVRAKAKAILELREGRQLALIICPQLHGPSTACTEEEPAETGPERFPSIPACTEEPAEAGPETCTEEEPAETNGETLPSIPACTEEPAPSYSHQASETLEPGPSTSFPLPTLLSCAGDSQESPLSNSAFTYKQLEAITNLLLSIDEIGRNEVIMFSQSLAQGIDLPSNDKFGKFQAMSYKIRDAFKSEEPKEERAGLTVDDLLKVPNFERKGKGKGKSKNKGNTPTLPVVISGEEHRAIVKKKLLEKEREEKDKFVRKLAREENKRKKVEREEMMKKKREEAKKAREEKEEKERVRIEKKEIAALKKSEEMLENSKQKRIVMTAKWTMTMPS
ncbi:hypothetical protein RRG08_031511 [Elysia crispata]|uniref:Ku domain-containing protein n=1 Tax=Elysia crispata TaxID=231223 RepID=A0AAE0XYH6_9GAST|nr:hypothetical protein RRG08_031511 [Elysia crispata]